MKQERDRIDEVIPFYKNEEKIISKNKENQLHDRESIKNIQQKTKHYQPLLKQFYKRGHNIAYQKAIRNMVEIDLIFDQHKNLFQLLDMEIYQNHNNNNNKQNLIKYYLYDSREK